MGSLADDLNKVFNKRRNFTRVHFASAALVNHADHTYLGKVSNVCLKGLHLTMPKHIPSDSLVTVTIAPPHSPGIVFSAKVVWTEQDELGIEIAQMPLASFSWLREVVTARALDPEGIINEVYRVTNCID